MKIDKDAIRDLAELLNETGLTEIEVADGDKVIRVGKGGTVIAGGGMPVAAPMPANAPMNADPAQPGPVSPSSSHAGAVLSPMVGTAYMSPEPDAAPFVSVGTKVSKGDTLMIVEAMKVMNQIKAEKSGTVTEIFVSDAQPVEFGEPLLAIE
jgi:acetyl-CoA carboxylase biotin carboxyl carrier protein